jgi:nickel/cobalt transporter (NiCoT) family protein
MTLIDSTDSIVMLYSYAGFPTNGWRLFEQPQDDAVQREREAATNEIAAMANDSTALNIASSSVVRGPVEANIRDPEKAEIKAADTAVAVAAANAVVNEKEEVEPPTMTVNLRVKRHLMSNLSVLLTAMSIVVAFRLFLNYLVCMI